MKTTVHCKDIGTLKSWIAAMLVGFFFSGAAFANDIACRVVGVSDGDTLTCLTSENRQIKTRLAQIDAPEKDQAFGQRSKQALSDLIFGKSVVLQPETTDKYGRTVAKVLIGGRDVNLVLVKTGMAWVYTQYARDQAYFAAEREARSSRAGLWSDPNPIRPSDWRHGGKSASRQAPTHAGSVDVIEAAQKKRSSSGKFSCDGKRVCGQMSSCDEAYFYLQQCGLGRLDRDKDGVPCESICGG